MIKRINLIQSNLLESDCYGMLVDQTVVTQQIGQLFLSATVSAEEKQRERAGQADRRVKKVAILVPDLVVGLEKV